MAVLLSGGVGDAGITPGVGLAIGVAVADGGGATAACQLPVQSPNRMPVKSCVNEPASKVSCAAPN